MVQDSFVTRLTNATKAKSITDVKHRGMAIIFERFLITATLPEKAAIAAWLDRLGAPRERPEFGPPTAASIAAAKDGIGGTDAL